LKIATLSRSASEQSLSQRIESLFQIILGRKPTPQEIQLATQFLESPQLPSESQSPDPERPWVQLTHALLASNEFIFID
jgi:hypothetical protein